jgi:hypothetical protein
VKLNSLYMFVFNLVPLDFLALLCWEPFSICIHVAQGFDFALRRFPARMADKDLYHFEPRKFILELSFNKLWFVSVLTLMLA